MSKRRTAKARRRESSTNGALSVEQVRAEIDHLAQEHLHARGKEALRRLDAGKLNGTRLEVALRTRQFLLAAAERTAR